MKNTESWHNEQFKDDQDKEWSTQKEKTLNELKKKGRYGSRMNKLKTRTWLKAELT